MVPKRAESLAKKAPESGDRQCSDSIIVRRRITECVAPTYEGLAKTLAEKPITQVAFYAYPKEDRSGIDFIELVPYDEELQGYGSFSLSNQEFLQIQSVFPGVNFIERRDMEVRFAEQLKAHGVRFPLPEEIAKMEAGTKQPAPKKRKRRSTTRRRAPEASKQTDAEAILSRLDELQEAARGINAEIARLTVQARALKK